MKGLESINLEEEIGMFLQIWSGGRGGLEAHSLQLLLGVSAYDS